MPLTETKIITLNQYSSPNTKAGLFALNFSQSLVSGTKMFKSKRLTV